MKAAFQILFILILILFSSNSVKSQSLMNKELWPEIVSETKPWSRWWWMGNAVDEPNIKNLIAEYSKAGFGGLEITPIYGAVGYENFYLKFLSPGWMKMLSFSVNEAKNNKMQIDMNLGTGWPFGGPQIDYENAASKLILQKYEYKKGESIILKVLPNEPAQINAGATLIALIAYYTDGSEHDIINKLDNSGTLNIIAHHDLILIAAFSGKTLQKVKRAAPGGEGLTFDHFSKNAFNKYITRFDSAFGSSNYGVRSFFNDSYEVYGTNWTSEFLKGFKTRRGYNLETKIKYLNEKTPSNDISRRVQCDYRETISDLLLENFTNEFSDWSNKKGVKTRNQAHGSPGNLLDLYAAVDIPECETFGASHFDIIGFRRDSADVRNVDPDPVMLKFASSAANVTGKKLISSESFTWLAEHFKVALSQCKPEAEQLFLSGVNHLFYHGTSYSPAEAGFPGWLFYASVNFAPSNSFWPHLKGMNDYYTRCQSVLQTGIPANDLLVYWPVYDVWMHPEKTEFMLSIHSIEKWLYETPFYNNVKRWLGLGYTLDFVSDKLLNRIKVENGKIITESGSEYKAIVIPECNYMPLSTIKLLLKHAQNGATIIFEKFPRDVPGFNNFEANRNELKKLFEGIISGSKNIDNELTISSNGNLIISSLPEKAFDFKNIDREKLGDSGLKFIKRKVVNGYYYYLVNHSAKDIDDFITLNEIGNTVLILDPQTGNSGLASINKTKQVKIQLNSGESVIVYVSKNKINTNKWTYLKTPEDEINLSENWDLKFIEGGKIIPEAMKLDKLASWTELGSDDALNYSGTAVYKTSFDIKVAKNNEYILDLGNVRESARVIVNGVDAGIIWSNPFEVRIGKLLKNGKNTIEIEVANLLANRIRKMDIDKTQWRNYHEINFVNINYKSFDASGWEPYPSGLLGPVKIKSFSTN